MGDFAQNMITTGDLLTNMGNYLQNNNLREVVGDFLAPGMQEVRGIY